MPQPSPGALERRPAAPGGEPPDGSAAVDPRLSPEQAMLRDQRTALAEMESQLAEQELDHATLSAELEAFTAQYLRAVGSRFATIDALRARLAARDAAARPADAALRAAADAARAEADATASAVAVPDESAGTFAPSPTLKQLYHRIARRAHPDLASGEEDRALRTAAMAEANRLYRAGDAPGLERLLGLWEHRPEAVAGDDTGAELVRVIRRIAQVRARLAAREADLATLRASAMFRLMTATPAWKAGQPRPFEPLRKELNAHIRALEDRLGI